jgi:hypothetical protein
VRYFSRELVGFREIFHLMPSIWALLLVAFHVVLMVYSGFGFAGAARTRGFGLFGRILWFLGGMVLMTAIAFGLGVLWAPGVNSIYLIPSGFVSVAVAAFLSLWLAGALAD